MAQDDHGGGPGGALTARVLRIQRMSTEDGPGIRSTVFFKGCSLACSWCQNPESIAREVQIAWHEDRCLGCGGCVAACPAKARELTEQGVRIAPDRCQRCLACVEACPTVASERLGEDWSVDALLAELLKDRSYYESGRGGVTLSGGEPALWPAFARELLRRCRHSGLHTALDTSGQGARSVLCELAAEADLVLLDLKDMDGERHRRFTGRSNVRILENAVAIAELRRQAGARAELWIRTPLIPGVTARADNLQAIGAFIRDRLGGAVSRWELCAFNNLCRSKYERLGLSFEHAETECLTAAELEHYRETARRSGVDPAIVHADGPLKQTGVT